MKIKKLLKFIGAAAACLTFAAVGTIFASAVTCGDFEVTGDSNSYSYDSSNRVLTITGTGAVTIANTDLNTATTDRIEVAKDISANITLAGVNIDVSSTGDISAETKGETAFKIADDSTGNVTITLADGTTNILKSGAFRAGLQKNGKPTSGTLTIKGGEAGTGKLEAIGGYMSAGIGGGIIDTAGKLPTITGYCFNIKIEGGVIIAKGGDGAAGIGAFEETGNITISDGTVTATGGIRGAGIGGGRGGMAYDIIISGGSVLATAGTDANAIGGGSGCDSVTPTLDDGITPVYLLEIDTDGTSEVTIDGNSYPKKHDTDNKIYAYLTQTDHTVKIGENETTYHAINDGFAACEPDTTAWVYNDYGHWHKCKGSAFCGVMFDYAEHSGGTATCVNKAVCEICKQEYGETCDTNHVDVATKWEWDESHHWHECNDCHLAVEKAEHTYGSDGFCTICGNYNESFVVTTTTASTPEITTTPEETSVTTTTTTTPAGTYPHYTGTRPNIVTTTTKATTTTTTTTTVEETTTTTATTTAKKTTAAETTVKKPAETTTTAKSDDSGVDGAADAVSGDENPITGVTISFSAVILAGAVVMATKKKRK